MTHWIGSGVKINVSWRVLKVDGGDKWLAELFLEDGRSRRLGHRYGSAVAALQGIEDLFDRFMRRWLNHTL